METKRRIRPFSSDPRESRDLRDFRDFSSEKTPFVMTPFSRPDKTKKEQPQNEAGLSCPSSFLFLEGRTFYRFTLRSGVVFFFTAKEKDSCLDSHLHLANDGRMVYSFIPLTRIQALNRVTLVN